MAGHLTAAPHRSSQTGARLFLIGCSGGLPGSVGREKVLGRCPGLELRQDRPGVGWKVGNSGGKQEKKRQGGEEHPAAATVNHSEHVK